MKQGLIKQGMYREQESSHLEWPDHMLHPYIPCRIPTILALPLFCDIAGVRPTEACCNQTPPMQYR